MGDPIKINVDLESSSINDAIAKAVVESRLGAAIKERIEAFLNNKSYGSPSLSDAMRSAVDSELQKIVTEMIHREFAATIKERVREQMTEKVITELVVKAVDKITSRYG